MPRLIGRLSDYSEEREVLIARLGRIRAGYHGEKRSDYYLENARFKNEIKVFTDVSLEVSPSNFIQIDTIVVSQYDMYVLEIKNVTGQLRFIQNPPSLHRTLDNGKITIMDCPVYQLEKNVADFNYWLEMNGFSCKSTGILVLSYLTSQVVVAPETMPIIYAKQLPYYLQRIESDSPIMSLEQLESFTMQIRKSHKPYLPIPLSRHFRVNPSLIKNGFFCDECHTKLERKSERTLTCLICEKLVGNPYATNLKDWFTLVKTTITVDECRKFLELKNKDAALYALKSLPLKKVGESRATKYYLLSNEKTLRS